MVEKLRKVRNFGIGLVVLIGVVVLPVLYLYGVVWFSEKALPWLLVGCLVAFAVCLLVLLPLSIFRRIRPWTGLGFYLVSYLFGTMLFALSCLVTVELWGVIGLIIGLLIIGVGVVPVAFLAALFHGEWSLLGYIVLGTVITFGTRFIGIRFAESNPDREELVEQESALQELTEQESEEQWEAKHKALKDVELTAEEEKALRDILED